MNNGVGNMYEGAGPRQGKGIKVFVTGVTGQLGHDVMIELAKRGYQVIGSGGRAGDDMKVFVTGVSGQLGHDCVNELVAAVVEEEDGGRWIWVERPEKDAYR